ncbi:hypothetical protein [Anaerophaga thermohalophila]|jgi:hypothetical protein|uniref:hypothetical protein n=1 Tax=Anaerophaga thermohalophila TaxID=177400 RepID=UPI000377DD2C|nr:hypothetical protein [Anaerophaga thermohalophila]
MKNCTIFLIVILSFTGILSLTAQENEEATLDRGPLSGQFDYTIEKSSKYEEFRVVRTAWLYKLKSNVIDTLEHLQGEINTRQAEIDSLGNQIVLLNEKLTTTQDKLEQAILSKNSIPFFGAEIQKGKYNTIMWALVLILAGGVAFLFLLFKRSHFITKQMQEKYEDLENEYEAHRKRALEKEKTMARQHLNELNKLRGRQ